MADLLINALRVVIVIIGVLLIYAAIFLYENEQRKVQNILEDWWLKIDERQRPLLSRHTNFMRNVAYHAASGFDRMFGHKLFSKQSIAVSASYSFASVFLSSFMVILYVVAFEPDVTSTNDPRVLRTAIVLLLLAGLNIVLAMLPLFIQSPYKLDLWLATVIVVDFLILLAIHIIFVLGEGPFFVFGLSIGVGLGIMSDIIFIAITRWALRWSAGLESFYKIISMILLNCLIALAFVGIPLFLNDWLPQWMLDNNVGSQTPKEIVDLSTMFFAMSNVLTTLIAFAFLIHALLMLAHKFFWPLIERPVYALQQLGIAKRNKLLGVVGITLIGLAAGITPSWLKEVIDKFTS